MKTPVIGVFEGGGIKGIALAGAAAAAMDTGSSSTPGRRHLRRCPGRIPYLIIIPSGHKEPVGVPFAS